MLLVFLLFELFVTFFLVPAHEVVEAADVFGADVLVEAEVLFACLLGKSTFKRGVAARIGLARKLGEIVVHHFGFLKHFLSIMVDLIHLVLIPCVVLIVACEFLFLANLVIHYALF